MNNADVDDRPEALQLLASLKANSASLDALRRQVREVSEDGVYRFYHRSFKVYRVQDCTLAIVEALQALAPGRPLHEDFVTIVREGTGHVFELSHNRHWKAVTRPILEAFFHAQYFLEMAVQFGKTLEAPPALLPNGWAGLLYLYNLR